MDQLKMLVARIFLFVGLITCCIAFVMTFIFSFQFSDNCYQSYQRFIITCVFIGISFVLPIIGSIINCISGMEQQEGNYGNIIIDRGASSTESSTLIGGTQMNGLSYFCRYQKDSFVAMTFMICMASIILITPITSTYFSSCT